MIQAHKVLPALDVSVAEALKGPRPARGAITVSLHPTSAVRAIHRKASGWVTLTMARGCEQALEQAHQNTKWWKEKAACGII